MAVKNVQARVLLRKAVTFKNAQVGRKYFEFIICKVIVMEEIFLESNTSTYSIFSGLRLE